VEWEYACRAGTQSAYFWGDDPDAGKGFANCADLTAKAHFSNWPVFNWSDGFVFTSPVGSFKPNAWGLYDMVGNAWEWCADDYAPYREGDAVDPVGKLPSNSDPSRCLRGGSWGNNPRLCRSACRYGNAPGSSYGIVGFRCALNYP
jgi:formylglycine-generating enzyme required for sulfatase activity